MCPFKNYYGDPDEYLAQSSDYDKWLQYCYYSGCRQHCKSLFLTNDDDSSQDNIKSEKDSVQSDDDGSSQDNSSIKSDKDSVQSDDSVKSDKTALNECNEGGIMDKNKHLIRLHSLQSICHFISFKFFIATGLAKHVWKVNPIWVLFLTRKFHTQYKVHKNQYWVLQTLNQTCIC